LVLSRVDDRQREPDRRRRRRRDRGRGHAGDRSPRRLRGRRGNGRRSGDGDERARVRLRRGPRRGGRRSRRDARRLRLCRTRPEKEREVGGKEEERARVCGPGAPSAEHRGRACTMGPSRSVNFTLREGVFSSRPASRRGGAKGRARA
jgi:hypothetical protein